MTCDLLRQVLDELKRVHVRLDALESPPVAGLVLTRQEAAGALRISVRQLQRLVAGGRIAALPSGIARIELERYARTPQPPRPKLLTRRMRERSAMVEAERGRAMLRAATKAGRAKRDPR